MGRNKNKNKNVGASKNKGGNSKKREQQEEWEDEEMMSHDRVDDRVVNTGLSCEDVLEAPASTERQEEDVLNASESQAEPPLIPETDEHDVTISQQSNSKEKDEGMGTAVQSTFAPQVTYAGTLQRPSSHKGKKLSQQQKQEEGVEVEAATEPQKTHDKVEGRVVANAEDSLQNASKSQEKPPLIPKTDEHDVTISQQMGKSNSKKKEGMGTAVQSEQPTRRVTFAPQVTYAGTLQRPSSNKGNKQPQQQKQEEKVEATSEPQKTHDKVEGRVLDSGSSCEDVLEVPASTERQEEDVLNASKSQDEPPLTPKTVEPPPSSAHGLANQRVIKSDEPSEEEPHSGESQTPTSEGEELTLAHLQSNLHHLLHAFMCRHRDINRIVADPAKCVHRCRELKMLLKHIITQCEAKKDERCDYWVYCLDYRNLLRHWIMCNYSECALCWSEQVRQITDKYDLATKDILAANK